MPAKTTGTKKGAGRTTLKFTGRVGKTEIVQPKTSPYNDQVRGGGMNVTLHIDMPEAPDKPEQWDNPGSEPKAPTKGPKETDAAFAKREEAFPDAVERWKKKSARWEALQDRYRRQVEALQGRQLQYAQLVGIGALLGQRKVTVTIQPHGQDLLPGFGAALVEAELPALGPGDDEDDEGFDD